jgi:hypothetical protein
MSTAKIRGNDLGIGLQASDLLAALNSELDGFNYSETTGLALEKDLTLGTLGEPGHIHLDDGDSGAVEIDVSPGELTIGADVVSTNDGPLASVADVQDEINAYTTTVTSAGTLTLTAASNYQQFFTGTTTHTVVLPVASTMIVGQHFVIENNSTRAVTINSSGGNLVATPLTGSSVKITCILASGTSAASWDVEYVGYSNVTAGRIALKINSDMHPDPQQTLDETGEYLPPGEQNLWSGNSAYNPYPAVVSPLFLATGQTIRGQGKEETSINLQFNASNFAFLGYPRGLIADNHWTGTGWRTRGTAFLLGRGTEWDLGPLPNNTPDRGWKTAHTFRIKFRATKNYGSNWAQPICGIQGIGGAYGPLPRPWVFYAESGYFKLSVMLEDGTTHTIVHPTASVSDTTVDIDWTVDLQALFGSGSRLANNSIWPFGLGHCPPYGNDSGYWGTTGVDFTGGDVADFTVIELSIYLNGNTRAHASLIPANYNRVPTYSGGSSLPLIIAPTDNGGTHLFIVHRSQFVSDSSYNVSISDLTINAGAANPAINIAGMLGGGLSLNNTRIVGGSRAIQTMGIFVAYPITILDSIFDHQTDCACWFSRTSGLVLDRVDCAFSFRTCAELFECAATIRGDLQLAPGEGDQDQVYSQIGGWCKYSRIISDYESTPPYPPFLRLTPFSSETQWPTIATLDDCQVGGLTPEEGRTPANELVTIEDRSYGYTGQVIVTVDGVELDETGEIINTIDGGNASSY